MGFALRKSFPGSAAAAPSPRIEQDHSDEDETPTAWKAVCSGISLVFVCWIGAFCAEQRSTAGRVMERSAQDVVCANRSEGRVLAAWKERQESVRSYSFQWSEEFTITAGAMGTTEDGPGQQPRNDLIPPSDVTLPGRGQIVIDGRRGFYSESRQQWSPSLNKVVPHEQVTVCTDGERRTLFSKRPVGFPLGTTARDESMTFLFAQDTCLPIALCYRILAPDFQVFAVRQMSLYEVPTASPNVFFSVASFSHGRGHVDLWLDPERDFIPTRYLVLDENGRTTGDVDITYMTSPSGWIPETWTSRVFDPQGVPRYTRRVRVSRWMLNPEVGSEQFRVTFPRGTWVNDESQNVSFVVLGANETRILQGDDLLREYESIMASRAQSWWLGRFCLVFLTFGIVVILGIGVWCRRRSADRNSHMSAR